MEDIKMKKLSVALMVAIFTIFTIHLTTESQTAKADSFQVYGGTQVKRLPRGTRMELKAAESVTTAEALRGHTFSAVLTNNLKLEKQLVLPAGTLVRGNIQEVKKAGRLSRSGVLYLNFDHVVTPSGRQLPIKAGLCSNFKLTKEGAITTGGNYGYALKQTWDKSTDIVKDTTQWGLNAGSELFTGGQYVLTPIAAVGGTVAAGGYLIVDSIADLFRKGDEVIINYGQPFDILLLEPLDVPVY